MRAELLLPGYGQLADRSRGSAIGRLHLRSAQEGKVLHRLSPRGQEEVLLVRLDQRWTQQQRQSLQPPRREHRLSLRQIVSRVDLLLKQPSANQLY